MGAVAKLAKAHGIVTRLTIRRMMLPRITVLRLPQRALGFELALARVVDGLPEDPRELLGGVKAHGSVER
jgi:hypothetical protein